LIEEVEPIVSDRDTGQDEDYMMGD